MKIHLFQKIFFILFPLNLDIYFQLRNVFFCLSPFCQIKTHICLFFIHQVPRFLSKQTLLVFLSYSIFLSLLCFHICTYDDVPPIYKYYNVHSTTVICAICGLSDSRDIVGIDSRNSLMWMGIGLKFGQQGYVNLVYLILSQPWFLI